MKKQKFNPAVIKRNKTVLTTIMLHTALLLSSSLEVRAVLIAYESFNYNPGDPWDNINVYSGGTGWNIAWTNQALSGPNWQNDATGLGYTDSFGNVLITSGGSVRDLSAVMGENNRWRRGFTATWAPGDETWFSFLTQRTDGNASTSIPWTFRLQNNTSTIVQIRNTLGPTDGWTIANASDVDQVSTTAVSELDLVLVVGRIIHAVGNDQLDVWFNPPNLASMSPIPTMSLNTFDFSGFNNIAIQSGSTTQGRWDEIRIGTTLFDVVPYIPEPSLLIPLGLMLILLMIYKPHQLLSQVNEEL